jgi:hypothetical protein
MGNDAEKFHGFSPTSPERVNDPGPSARYSPSLGQSRLLLFPTHKFR